MLTATQMTLVPCETEEEVDHLKSGIWPTVIFMTFKGNLRHRIELVGEEIEYVSLTEKQKVLRRIAAAQGFEARISGHLARPSWGGGAFFYCEPAHALLIQENMHLLPFQVMSKHIVCSPQYEAAVRDCMEDHADGAPPVGMGREVFNKKQSSMQFQK